MAQQSILTDEIRREIGYQTEPIIIEVDKTLLRLFTQAVGDINPLWTDDAEARKGPYGGIIAPPSLLCSSMATSYNLPYAHIPALQPMRRLDGGGEWEFYRPIRLGDTITATASLHDMTEKRGRLGPMVIVTSEITWHNQRQALVARAYTTAIRY